MAPFVMQIGGRDSPDEVAGWRFRIDRFAWIVVAFSRSRLRKHSEVNKLRSLAVPREIGTHLARRHIGKRIGDRRPVTTVPATPADATVRNFLREKASSPDGSVAFSFLDVMRPAPLMWSSEAWISPPPRTQYGSCRRAVSCVYRPS